MSRARIEAPTTAFAAFVLMALAAPPSSLAQSSAEIGNTERRLSQELPCVRAQQERLASTLRLLEEAERQVRSSTSGEAARRDAVHSAEALELRLGVIVGELRACLGQAAPQTVPANPSGNPSGTTPGTASPPPPRVIVHHQDDLAVHPAETQNAATEVLDAGRALGRDLFLVQAERVDGLGRANPEDVLAAVNRVAPAMASCYQTLSASNGRQRGRAYLTFTVTPEGRMRDIRLEDFSIFDRTFQRCVGAAAGRLRIARPAVGGAARYSFHLRFGPPPDYGTPEVD